MTLSRRTLVLGAGSTILGAGVAAGLLTWPDDDAPGEFDLLAATAELFRAHLGSTFRLSGPGTPAVDTRLRAVDLATEDGITNTFVLWFDIGKNVELPQNTYQVRHGELGSFDLFLVPGTARSMSAVVSHLR